MGQASFPAQSHPNRTQTRTQPKGPFCFKFRISLRKGMVPLTGFALAGAGVLNVCLRRFCPDSRQTGHDHIADIRKLTFACRALRKV